MLYSCDILAVNSVCSTHVSNQFSDHSVPRSIIILCSVFLVFDGNDSVREANGVSDHSRQVGAVSLVLGTVRVIVVLRQVRLRLQRR